MKIALALPRLYGNGSGINNILGQKRSNKGKTVKSDGFTSDFFRRLARASMLSGVHL
jgi:hypothetical protein